MNVPTRTALILLAGLFLGIPRAEGARPRPIDGRGPFRIRSFSLPLETTSVTTGASRRLEVVFTVPRRPRRAARTPLALVVFSHGSCGTPTQSSFVTRALASWGLAVAAPTHPGNQIRDGLPACTTPAALIDSYANRVPDVRAVVDAILGGGLDRPVPAIDPGRIAVMGHSFGGQTALRAAIADPRFVAIVALAPALPDLVPAQPIAIPGLVMGADRDSLTPFDPDTVGSYTRLAGPRYLIRIRDAGHFVFGDVCPGEFLGSQGDCDPDILPARVSEPLVRRYVVAFLLRYLAGRDDLAPVLEPANAPAQVDVLDARASGP